MHNQEEPTPITSGAEIKTEKAMEEEKDIRDKALLLYKRVVEATKEKQAEIDTEFKKPLDEQDLKLVTLYYQDLEKLKKIEDGLDKGILGSLDKTDKLRERWLKLLELTETIETFNVIDAFNKDQ